MKNQLRRILQFFLSHRRSGTTTLLKEIAGVSDVWVLVPTAEMKKEFGDKAISIDDLDKAMGMSSRPILVDNFTMIRLCEAFDINISKLEFKVKQRELLINSIDHLIDNFKRDAKNFTP